jgi:hypothetical protein
MDNSRIRRSHRSSLPAACAMPRATAHGREDVNVDVRSGERSGEHAVGWLGPFEGITQWPWLDRFQRRRRVLSSGQRDGNPGSGGRDSAINPWPGSTERWQPSAAPPLRHLDPRTAGPGVGRVSGVVVRRIGMPDEPAAIDLTVCIREPRRICRPSRGSSKCPALRIHQGEDSSGDSD